jgi:quercetin dioxygenase-like cupin family protein
VFSASLSELSFSEAWIEGDGSARWRSAAVHGPGTGATASGSSVLEVEPGCALGRHTDSAEEAIVVLTGSAEVSVGEETGIVEAGGIAIVPKDVPHTVRNAGGELLRFAAIYAEPEVVTTYEDEVQPDRGRERNPVA